MYQRTVIRLEKIRNNVKIFFHVFRGLGKKMEVWSPRSLSEISDRQEGTVLSQMFRSFEANRGTIQRKGSENLATSGHP